MTFNWEEWQGEVDYATYDPTDDKLRVYSGRVERELYDEMRGLGFQRAYKQGCFFAAWSPAREDAALALCGDVEEEGGSALERAEARAERFDGYHESAKARSDAAYKAVRDITDHIPFGQPILVGHHSEGRARRDQDRIDRGMRKTVDEGRKAERWRERARDVLAHAERRERPDVILRRIKKLEADRRRHERDKVPTDLGWTRIRVVERLFGHGMYDEYELTPEQDAQVTAEIERMKLRNEAHQDRWIEHIDGRLAYERELYEAADGPKPTEMADQLKKGCYVKTGRGWEGPVLRVNKGRDGQVSSVSVPSGYSWNNTIKLDRIKEVRDGEADQG